MSSTFTKLYEQKAKIPDHNMYNARLVSKLLPSGKKLSVLDAGCGFGFITNSIKELGHNVLGIDAQEYYIDCARKSYPDIRFEVVSVMNDLSQLAPDDGWDVIVSTEVIEHIYAPQQFLVNVGKQLKKGGVILIGTPYHGYLKNLTIALINGFDKHFMVAEEGGHIKFFPPRH